MPKKDYSKYLVKKPAYEVTPDFEVKGRRPAMTLLRAPAGPLSSVTVSVPETTRL